MSAAKRLAFGGLLWALSSTAASAAPDAAQRDGSWIFFFNGTGNSPSRTTEVTPAPVPPISPPNPSPSSSPAPATNLPYSNPYAVMRTPLFASSPSVSTADMSTIVPSTAAPTADAFLNFGTSSFLEASQLTVGTPQAWFTSPVVTKFFEGQTPSPQQQADFTNKVLQDVRQTFSLSGLSPTVTLAPQANAAHTMSIVSGASYAPNANAIGITDVGHNGFGFIDKFTYANTVDDLAMAVAHNVSHELMHAFGVGNHPDTTGAFVDAGTASWPLLTNPNATFSPAAVKAINDAQSNGASGAGYAGAQTLDGAQEILAKPVPEPSTVALWVAGLGFAAFCGRRRALNRP